MVQMRSGSVPGASVQLELKMPCWLALGAQYSMGSCCGHLESTWLALSFKVEEIELNPRKLGTV